MAEQHWINLTSIGDTFEVELDILAHEPRYRWRPANLQTLRTHRLGREIHREAEWREGYAEALARDVKEAGGKCHISPQPTRIEKPHDPSRPRCPQCGFPVDSFFDHVDRNGVDEKGECK